MRYSLEQPARATVSALGSQYTDAGVRAEYDHFRRLVLGWINADFRLQIRFLQYFKIYKNIIFSQANLQNVCKNFEKILEIFRKLANFAKFRKLAFFL